MENKTVTITKLFPWASVETDNDNKILYEQNIANIIRQVVTNNFVIEGNLSGGALSEDAVLKINIYGYYIEIRDTDFGNNAYLKLNLKNGGDEVVQGDANPVSIIPSDQVKQTLETYPHLCLHITDNEGKIPKESRLRFSKESLDLLEIDGWHTITG